MKNTTQNSIVNLSSFLRILVFCISLFKLNSAIAQGPPFENHFGVNSGSNDGLSMEFVTCPSIDANYTYAGVQSFQSSGQMKIRGVRVTASGTMFTSTFDFIAPTTAALDIFPLKIITFMDQNGQSAYLITGYITDQNTPDLPNPFVMQADNNLNATSFKVFTDHNGFFTDVDQLTNGDLIFCGSTTDALTIAAPNRLGWMLRTDNSTFTTQWMRYISLYNHSSANSHQDFDIVHDLILIDDDSAIICGNVSEHVDCVYPSALDSTRPRVFIAKVDLNDGSFAWHKCRFIKNLAARLVMNNAGTIIALGTNGDIGLSAPAIIFFDRSGNIISSNHFETAMGKFTGVPFRFNGTTTLNCEIYAHVPFIQNIYFKSNDADIFISGKFIKTVVKTDPALPPQTTIGSFDMSFSTGFDGSNFGNIDLYKSAQVFTPQGFLSYTKWNSINCGELYPTLVSASNTLPCLSNCGTDEFVTITVDVGSVMGTIGQDKVWMFSDENTSLCGYETKAPDQSICAYFDHINISNDDIMVVPEVTNESFTNSDPSRILHNCEQ